MAPLLEAAALPEALAAAIRKSAHVLVSVLRAKGKGSGMAALVQEFSLSSQEGVALMCLAEALLRIPDTSTRNALIREKIAAGDWNTYLGGDRSLFVNAATWGLFVTGKLSSTVDNPGLSAALTRLIGRFGEPIIRRGVELAIRLMGERFVTGETIEEALKRSRTMEARGFTYSFDMLGEGAVTAADAERYHNDYEKAVHAIGKASAGRGIFEGPGISIKLSALHPRYERRKARRVMDELLPRLKALCLLAKAYDIGLNIDAEESHRAELSLDLLEELAADPELAGWNGLGFVVQAYGKRCPYVLDFIIDLAKRSHRRIMVRLVKGAYWDAEIKQAQLDGLEDFPVYTRKVHTDVAYIACARKLLAAAEHVFPQFATHNAQTLATIYHLAGPDFALGMFEFQCLHGMGEPLYEEVVGRGGLNRPCRIYAPVGNHETLLAYLVRRLLENGANSSFINRVGDPAVPIEDLIADPAATVLASREPGLPNELIRMPNDLFDDRRNSAGLDFASEQVLASLSRQLCQSARVEWRAAPTRGDGEPQGVTRPVSNPAWRTDIVGSVREATETDVAAALSLASAAAAGWAQTPAAERAVRLDKAATLLEERMPLLIGLLVREAGKTVANAVGEVREAVDFLRYYAAQARELFAGPHAPLGVVVCISPWNFPLAIFTGQVAAALAAGNAVIAKPAEETPLVAAEAIRIIIEAGVGRGVVQLLPGDGRIGAALVASPQVAGVMFTGSTEVARLIQEKLAQRLSPQGRPVTLIAETGGQNAMIVDSSALTQQVVADVIASAFDSAGQRCSALRILCIQEEVEETTLEMLRGAVKELAIGRTDELSADIGPVISQEAQSRIEAHIDAMKAKGHKIEQVPLSFAARAGSFVAPTIIEIEAVDELEREVFGPVLHVVRFQRDRLGDLIDSINALGYGLTFGLHSRLEDTIAQASDRIQAGNLYINRNMIGAAVGVQPFGGHGLSGTGPKAGGPLYLPRLARGAGVPRRADAPLLHELKALAVWLDAKGQGNAAAAALAMGRDSLLGQCVELPGPVGERNIYSLRSRGAFLLLPSTPEGLYQQMAACLATGNRGVVMLPDGMAADMLSDLPPPLKSRFEVAGSWPKGGKLAGVLAEAESDRLQSWLRDISGLAGPVLPVQAASPGEAASCEPAYCLDWMLEEIVVSTNTAAAGGNATLMTIA